MPIDENHLTIIDGELYLRGTHGWKSLTHDVESNLQCPAIFQVGDIFITTLRINPAELMKFGTWELSGQGKLTFSNGTATDDLLFVWKRIT